MEKIYLFIIGLILVQPVFSQSDSLKKRKPIEFDILYNYYSQDGNQSAVTGGRGTEKLTNNDTQLSLFIPFKGGDKLNVLLGVDYYTSASALEINKYVSAASTGTSSISGQDTRTYLNLKYGTEKFTKLNDFSVNIGFSTEYDVLSFNGGFGFMKKLKKGRKILWKSSLYVDSWSLIYPGEFDENGIFNGIGSSSGYGSHSGGSSSSSGSSGGGSTTGGGSTGGGSGSGSSGGSSGSGSSGSGSSGSGSSGSGFVIPYNYILKDGSSSSSGGGSSTSEDTPNYEKDNRYSINNALTFKQIINKRMNIAFVGEFNLQLGLLSTPFHRVYFNDGVNEEKNKLVAIEHLPEQRFKGVLGIHYNYFFSKNTLLKLSYRTYYDSWNLFGQTAQIILPVKLNRFMTFYPFYRFHFQNGAKYYRDYGQHSIIDNYHTSDSDLDKMVSNKLGLGISIHPVNGILSYKKKSDEIVSLIKSFDMRYAYYKRSNGLSAHSLSIGMSFIF
ncbi:MAG: hypothetical protein COA38_03205 [Fluviicola sp.]|nr:MAG: hypothetical protein COA38_03205 [Fluviicola sp.]